MEKYAVVTDDVEQDKKPQRNKSGTVDKTCPLCHTPLEPNVNVSRCAVHGTRPFEGK
jgi:hypothetical protein